MRVLRNWEGIVSSFKNGSTVHYKQLEGGGAQVHGSQGGHIQASRKSSRPLIVATVLVLCFLSYATYTSRDAWSTDAGLVDPGMVHMLFPANTVNADLCKTLLSSQILGYPAATLVNWNKTFDDPNLSAGGSHLKKITGIKHYLNDVTPDRDEDLIIIADGYDTWFQLRPQTLIERYFDINRRADERLWKRLGSRAMRSHNISQKIVFSTQKQCWPWSADDAPCYAIPESTLPKGIYGPDTDVFFENAKNPYWSIRQRFLNSGVAIGTIAAMRKLYTEAAIRMEKNANFGSDQYIIAEILGDQELYREIVRRNSMSWWKRLLVGFFGDSDRINIKSDSPFARVTSDNTSFEFGLGVDSDSSISLATIFADNDTAWIRYNDVAHIDAINKGLGIGAMDSRVTVLAPEIKQSELPFWQVKNQTTGLSRDTEWEEVPILTDMWTGFAPAVIHHNAWQDDMKSRRETWWEKTWFQQHARALLASELDAEPAPIAYAGNKVKRAWWSVEGDKIGARTDQDQWMSFESICGKDSDELFRDSQGPWVRSKYHAE